MWCARKEICMNEYFWCCVAHKGDVPLDRLLHSQNSSKTQLMQYIETITFCSLLSYDQTIEGMELSLHCFSFLQTLHQESLVINLMHRFCTTTLFFKRVDVQYDTQYIMPPIFFSFFSNNMVQIFMGLFPPKNIKLSVQFFL